MNELIFRLLKNEEFVGYMKYMTAKMSFFSKDMYGWNAKKIAYDDKDAFSSLKDKNQRLLFENDLFKHRHYPDSVFIIDQADYGAESTIYQLVDNHLTIPTIDFYNESPHMLEFFAFLKDNVKLKTLIDQFKS